MLGLRVRRVLGFMVLGLRFLGFRFVGLTVPSMRPYRRLGVP